MWIEKQQDEFYFHFENIEEADDFFTGLTPTPSQRADMAYTDTLATFLDLLRNRYTTHGIVTYLTESEFLSFSKILCHLSALALAYQELSEARGELVQVQDYLLSTPDKGLSNPEITEEESINNEETE